MPGVPKAIEDDVESSVGHLAVDRMRLVAVDGGEGPQDATVDDQAFGLRAIGREIVGEPGHPAAMFLVERRTAPEWENMLEQMLTHRFGKLVDVARHFGGRELAESYLYSISTREICASLVNVIVKLSPLFGRAFKV